MAMNTLTHPNSGKTVKLVTQGVELLIEEIEEYVCGFQFFYVRYKATGKTESFDRNNIVAAYRKLPTGDFRPIHLKKVKTYEGFED